MVIHKGCFPHNWPSIRRNFWFSASPHRKHSCCPSRWMCYTSLQCVEGNRCAETKVPGSLFVWSNPDKCSALACCIKVRCGWTALSGQGHRMDIHYQKAAGCGKIIKFCKVVVRWSRLKLQQTRAGPGDNVTLSRTSKGPFEDSAFLELQLKLLTRTEATVLWEWLVWRALTSDLFDTKMTIQVELLTQNDVSWALPKTFRWRNSPGRGKSQLELLKLGQQDCSRVAYHHVNLKVWSAYKILLKKIR